MNRLLIAPLIAATLCLASVSQAKLPPPSDEAKAQSAEAAVKSAHAAKVRAFEVCQAQERIVARYQAGLRESGKTVPTPTPTPACTAPPPAEAAKS